MMEHFFPDPDDPKMTNFTRAFVRLMFAHAEFERRVSELVSLITRQPGFGELPKNRFSAKNRAKEVERLCSENASKHAAGLPETEAIVRLLNEACPLCDDRNWLAHGNWWRLDTTAGVITVRAAKEYPDEPLHRNFTFEEIDQTSSKLRDLEAELYKLQSAESRLPPDPDVIESAQ
jgi:hypothetical protein